MITTLAIIGCALWIISAFSRPRKVTRMTASIFGSMVILLVSVAITDVAKAEKPELVDKGPYMIEYCVSILNHANNHRPLAYALQAADFYLLLEPFNHKVRTVLSDSLKRLVAAGDFSEAEIRMGAEECLKVWMRRTAE